VHGRVEKELCLIVANKLRKKLEQLTPRPVLVTRVRDTFVALDERVQKSLDEKGAAFISLHMNQVVDKRYQDSQGIIVYSYGPRRDKARAYPFKKPRPMAAPPRGQRRSSANFATFLTKVMRKAGFKTYDPAQQDYYVLKNPDMPSVLIELGFLTHPDEGKRLADPIYQDRLVDALAHGIVDYLPTPKIQPVVASR